MEEKKLIRKSDTDWVRDNLLFNYCMWDDYDIVIESFVRNNGIELHFDINEYYVCITGVEKKYYTYDSSEKFASELEHIRHAMECMKSAMADKGFSGDILMLKPDNSKRFVCIFSPVKDIAENPGDIAIMIREIYDSHYPRMKKHNAVALAGPYSGYRALSKAAGEAMRLYDLKFFDLKNSLITSGLVSGTKRDVDVNILMENLRRLRNTLCTGRYEDCIKLTNSIFRDFLRPSLSIKDLRGAESFLEDVFRLFDRVYPEEGSCGFKSFENFEFLVEYQNHVKKVIRNLFDRTDDKPRYTPNIMMVINCIRTNPAENMSLTQLAEYVGLNAASLSSQFHNETGLSITEFISVSRIKKACGLLSSTSLTAAEIAALTGFGSAEYFRKVFKKHKGMTPSEYRKNQG